MSAINDGGPAFPGIPVLSGMNNDIASPGLIPGMTLRDYFAIRANTDDMPMQGGIQLLGRPPPQGGYENPLGVLRWWADYRAALRYMEADAMLAARK